MKMNETCVLCNISDFNIDEDYQLCYNCFFFYEEHNPNVIEDFENGEIIKLEKNLNLCLNCDSNNIILMSMQYSAQSQGLKCFTFFIMMMKMIRMTMMMINNSLIR